MTHKRTRITTRRTESLLVAALFAALLVTTWGATQAAATTLLRMSLSQMAQAADTIVRGRCIGISSRWDAGSIWTFADVDLVETLKGSPPARIIVRLPGGRVGNLATHVDAAPSLQPGDEKILFLEKTRANDYAVTAWAEGAFRIGRNSRGEETVTQESSEIPVFDAVTRQFATQGIHNVPISDFRQRLAGVLATLPERAR
jgi:hypothetical protein